MKRPVVIAVLATIPAGLGFIGCRAWWRVYGIERQFNALQRYTTREEIYARLGEPDMVEPCSTALLWELVEPFAAPQPPVGCVELSYHGYLERWIVQLDSQGRAIGRYHATSE